jgi:hypothetical protein
MEPYSFLSLFNYMNTISHRIGNFQCSQINGIICYSLYNS